MKTLRPFLISGLPLLLGLGFIGIVWLNKRLFIMGVIITPRGAIGIELLYLLVFFVVAGIAVIAAIRSFLERHLGLSFLALINAVLALVSIGLGWVLIEIGVSHGAAIIYAT